MKQAAAVAFAGSVATLAYYQGMGEQSSELFDVDQVMLQKFDSYIAEFGKSYGTKEEYMFRLKIFAKNHQEIEEHNEKYADDDATWAINHMADWTPKEYQRLLGFKDHAKKHDGKKHHKGEHHKGEHHGKHHGHHGHKRGRNMQENDTAIDWRTQGAVTPVKNQGQCGSCWAFSSTGAMEGAYFNKNSDLKSLSEQQLVDCATKEGNQGCNGGLMDYAFKYAQSNMMDVEADYPYTAKQAHTCSAKGTVPTLSGFQDVKANDPVALSTALQTGPVSIAVDANTLAWQFYSGGIVHRGCGTELDHGVLLVGQGTEGETDYWIIKNSWGASWGENGYIRVMREMEKSGPGVCGEQQQASYPEY